MDRIARKHLHPTCLMPECSLHIKTSDTMPDTAPTSATAIPPPSDPAQGAGPNATLFSPPQTEKAWRRSFWALILTQFQGAFSANVLRYLLSFMVLGMALNDARRNTLVSLITLLFFVPLILFSMAGGYLADRYSKRQVTIATKLIEIAAMALTIVAFTAPQKEALVNVTDLWQHPGLLFSHFPLPFAVLFV